MRFVAILSSVGLVLASANTAGAQSPLVTRSGPLLVCNAYVMPELKLNREQVEKVTQFYTRHNNAFEEVVRVAGNDLAKLQLDLQKFYAAEMEELAGFLTPEQIKRLRQIRWQQGGADSLAYDDDLQSALKVIPDQRDRLRKIDLEMLAKADEVWRNRAADFQGFRTLYKEYADKAIATLTPEQQKTYKDLLGKPLEVFWGGRGGGV